MVQLNVSFEAPDPTTITLQGPTLDAYYEWQDDPSEENEQYLVDMIYAQCADHIEMWSSIKDWQEND